MHKLNIGDLENVVNWKYTTPLWQIIIYVGWFGLCVTTFQCSEDVLASMFCCVYMPLLTDQLQQGIRHGLTCLADIFSQLCNLYSSTSRSLWSTSTFTNCQTTNGKMNCASRNVSTASMFYLSNGITHKVSLSLLSSWSTFYGYVTSNSKSRTCLLSVELKKVNFLKMQSFKLITC